MHMKTSLQPKLTFRLLISSPDCKYDWERASAAFLRNLERSGNATYNKMASLVTRRLLSPYWTLTHSRALFVGVVMRAKTNTQRDPVQQLFLDKLQEYNTKSKGGGTLSPHAEARYQEELERLKRIYGGGDMSKFPKFTFEEK